MSQGVGEDAEFVLGVNCGEEDGTAEGEDTAGAEGEETAMQGEEVTAVTLLDWLHEDAAAASWTYRLVNRNRVQLFQFMCTLLLK